MDTVNYISDGPLPLNQDFKSLKEEALAFIQEYSGSEWTNLNASDPGVTILDQLCFALTELGYCNDFPVADILTEPDGKINFKDQFYLPEDILTTSPVTIADYRKYIIDSVDGAQNAMIYPDVNAINGSYKVYLMIDRKVSDAGEINDICKAAFFSLVKRRNLGEMFSQVSAFSASTHTIAGRIELANEKDTDEILAKIDASVRNYIFPAVTQKGYWQLMESGLTVNDIFNGPLLQNGWIQASALGEKKEQLSIVEIAQLVEAVDGVKSSSLSGFDDSAPPAFLISSTREELLVIDIDGSLSRGLEIYCNGKKLSLGFYQDSHSTGMNTPGVNIELGAAVNVQTSVPEGQFRDINSYYSIQNTFPEIFAVGPNAITSNASAFQIAQSRQLKGYLTLFDQVLANQFSQLANIGCLFSFKNCNTGNPSDRHQFYAAKDKFDKWQTEYPVPYQAFSPTYFYQSLYDVPNIKHLLKDFDTFEFAAGPIGEKELAIHSWAAYKLDPYNPYIWGLMDIIEDERVGLKRRDDILDHLLARHGESPLVINTIIEGSIYTGDTLKDGVIFKSLYLQNLGLLSYNRQKAGNYLAAAKISGTIVEMPLRAVQNALENNPLAIKDTPSMVSDLERHLGLLSSHDDDTHDFIFSSEHIDRVELLKDHDFIDYPAAELKLSLLFGLKACYRTYLANYYAAKTETETDQPLEVKLAFWMIKERRGLILLETALLWHYTEFEIIITSKSDPMLSLQVAEELSLEQALALDLLLGGSNGTGLALQIQRGSLTAGGAQYFIKAAGSNSNGLKKHKLIAGTNYLYTIKLKYGIETGPFEGNPVFSNRVELLFPSFIPQFTAMEFSNRLDLFLQHDLPVQIGYKYHFVDSDYLQAFIPEFAAWHNSLIYQGPGTSEIMESRPIQQCVAALAGMIININAN